MRHVGPVGPWAVGFRGHLCDGTQRGLRCVRTWQVHGAGAAESPGWEGHWPQTIFLLDAVFAVASFLPCGLGGLSLHGAPRPPTPPTLP